MWRYPLPKVGFLFLFGVSLSGLAVRSALCMGSECSVLRRVPYLPISSDNYLTDIELQISYSTAANAHSSKRTNGSASSFRSNDTLDSMYIRSVWRMSHETR